MPRHDIHSVPSTTTTRENGIIIKKEKTLSPRTWWIRFKICENITCVCRCHHYAITSVRHFSLRFVYCVVVKWAHKHDDSSVDVTHSVVTTRFNLNWIHRIKFHFRLIFFIVSWSQFMFIRGAINNNYKRAQMCAPRFFSLSTSDKCDKSWNTYRGDDTIDRRYYRWSILMDAKEDIIHCRHAYTWKLIFETIFIDTRVRKFCQLESKDKQKRVSFVHTESR